MSEWVRTSSSGDADNRANWKIDQVVKARNELLDAIMPDYRNLIPLARRNNLHVSASPQDIGVWGVSGMRV
ncbi:class I adenylate cyclase [Escherichia coli]